MAGIYGGYGHENGLTSPTAEDPASVQPPNIAQWVILLLKHDYWLYVVPFCFKLAAIVEIVE